MKRAKKTIVDTAIQGLREYYPVLILPEVIEKIKKEVSPDWTYLAVRNYVERIAKQFDNAIKALL